MSSPSPDAFDSHDDRDDDGEGESVEEHKSVIMHLLSQVRLGMDLTKVKRSVSLVPHLAVHRGAVFDLLFISMTRFQFYSLPCSFCSGGPAHLHPRKTLVVRDVRRLLCTSRLVCKVIHAVPKTNGYFATPTLLQVFQNLNCDSRQHCRAAGAPGAHGASGEVVPVGIPCGEERLSGQKTLQPHPGRSVLLPLGPAK